MFDFKFSQPGYRVSSTSVIVPARTRYREDIYEVKCILEVKCVLENYLLI